MQCKTISLELAEVADGRSSLPAGSKSHVERCLRCQAELAQYRKLLRSLTALKQDRLVPDDDLFQEIVAAVGPGASVHRLHRITHRHKKVAYIGGLAAASAAGAIVLASRLANKEKLAS